MGVEEGEGNGKRLKQPQPTTKSSFQGEVHLWIRFFTDSVLRLQVINKSCVGEEFKQQPVDR